MDIIISYNQEEVLTMTTAADALSAFFFLHHILAVHYESKSSMTLLEYCAGLRSKANIKITAVKTLIGKMSVTQFK